ncbi:hypothetical protein EV195_102135 [Tenacibaculum skagerrakense]|uniref:Uncharacterized protein n=1 Tax=Tenacibaculum skagerrakense TaxID=186571 RepID=A0A4R2NX86_9FLAO|nr:hypothetical protein [Tenacibaculum skagerrakense]TCP26793.1 hypothetical protein EV195_102135 [Tenacibaculum skagerrakense]
MLGLILLYVIGKKFHELADNYEKSKWGYAIIGVIVYYVGAIGIGMILLILLEYLGLINIDGINDVVLSFMIAPFGILSCYLLYRFLEKKWEREKPKVDSDIEQIGNKD